MINKIHVEDCVCTMKKIPDNFIDLVVTSPPYDDLRTFKGHTIDFNTIANELYRVTKPGGIVAWIVGDVTKNFCESLSSFKQAIYFVEVAGFNLLDTMAYLRANVPPTYPTMKRYSPAFEYIFILSKGKPGTFNPIRDRPNTKAGKKIRGTTQRQKDGALREVPSYTVSEFGMRFNYWIYEVGKNKDTTDEIALKHPGRFPELLARDLIVSYSNEGDLVYDPMAGSGTTIKQSILLNRKYIGSEISPEYAEIIYKRIESLRYPD